MRERSRIVNHGLRLVPLGALAENSTSWQGPSNAYFEGPFALPGDRRAKVGLRETPAGVAAKVPVLENFPQILCTARWIKPRLSVQRGGKTCAIKVEKILSHFGLRPAANESIS